MAEESSIKMAEESPVTVAVKRPPTLEELGGWITLEFLTESLQQEEGKENIVVIRRQLKTVVESGNNYGSILLRVIVTYKENEDDDEEHTLTVITKTEVTEGRGNEITKGMDIVEPIFYNKFLPLAKEVLKAAENELFCPRNLACSVAHALVLEDLYPQGYRMADKVKMLDYEHSLQYVSVAATFHAVSFAVHKNNPDLVESMGKEKHFTSALLIGKRTKVLMKIGQKFMADGADKIEKFRKYSNTIRAFSEHIWDLIVEAHKPREVLNTINQGDPWTANMMFKYDENGKVCDIKLLDFQFLRFASPVNDLVTFFWFSADHNVKRYRIEELYNVYLDRFNQKLGKFQCAERMTYDQLRKNITILHPLAIHVAAMSCLVLHPDQIMDLDKLLGKNEKIVEEKFKVYFNDEFRKQHLPNILEALKLNGVFDYMDKYLRDNTTLLCAEDSHQLV